MLRKRGRSRVRSKEERKSRTSGEEISKKPKVEKKQSGNLAREDVLQLISRPRKDHAVEEVEVDVEDTQPTDSPCESVPVGIGHVFLEKC